MTGRGLGADTASLGQQDTTKSVGLDVPTRFAAVHESGCVQVFGRRHEVSKSDPLYPVCCCCCRCEHVGNASDAEVRIPPPQPHKNPTKSSISVCHGSR